MFFHHQLVVIVKRFKYIELNPDIMVIINASMGDLERLALVGYHEQNVMDQMIAAAVNELQSRGYKGLILTGTSDLSVPVVENGVVRDELRYMHEFFTRSSTYVPISEEIPARTLMGNVKHVLSAFPRDVTFLVDRSHFQRLSEFFIPYFIGRMPYIENIQVIAPEHSFRAGSNYERHSGRADAVYSRGLRIPGVARVIEHVCCSNHAATRRLIALKNWLASGSAS